MTDNELSFTQEELRTMPSNVLLQKVIDGSLKEHEARRRADFEHEKLFNTENGLLRQEALSRMAIRQRPSPLL